MSKQQLERRSSRSWTAPTRTRSPSCSIRRNIASIVPTATKRWRSWLGSPILQFVNGECDQLSMELFLDDYTDPEGPTSSRKRRRPVAQQLGHFAPAWDRPRPSCARPYGSIGGRWNSWHHREARAQDRKFNPTAPARATLSALKEYRISSWKAHVNLPTRPRRVDRPRQPVGDCRARI